MSAEGDVIRLERRVRDLEARLAVLQRANETAGRRFAFTAVEPPAAPGSDTGTAAQVTADDAPALDRARAAWQRAIDDEKPGPAVRWVPPRFRRAAR